jgi:putative transport protein
MLDWIFELPQTSPVAHALGLIMFVCAAGMAVGSIKVRNVGLGGAGVLFMGILIAQFSQPIDEGLLNFVKEFGLVLFVFTIGLQLGPGFFASLRAEGLRLNFLTAALVVLAGGLAPLLGWLVKLDPVVVPGLFAGASTNAPALGAAQQSLAALPGVDSARLALPALACAVSYTGAFAGVLGVLLLLKALFRIDPVQEAETYAAEQRQTRKPLVRRSIVIENSELAGLTLDEVSRRAGAGVVISRMRRRGETEVRTALPKEKLALGDTVLGVGDSQHLDQLERLAGCSSDEDLMTAPGNITFRRLVVTNKEVLGKTPAELDLENTLGVMVTRIVRGDSEMTAVPHLRLLFGDVLHIVGAQEQLEQAAQRVGNSLHKLNETQFIPLFAGILLGVLAGSLPLAIPGMSQPVRVGLAGGSLIVGLLLGRLGHLGGLVWHMPLSANRAFREFGVALFFAALGLAAGDQFLNAALSPRGLTWLVTGLVITVAPLLAVGV